MLNIHKGIVIPVKAVEGAISIAETVSVNGDGKKPVVAAPIKQGDAVAITGDLQVEKADGTNGVVIGFEASCGGGICGTTACTGICL